LLLPKVWRVRLPEAFARFGGLLATDLKDVTDDPAALDNDGWWAVVLTYEGDLTAARFGDVRPSVEWPIDIPSWTAIAREEWASSMSRDEYMGTVEKVRVAISEGTVYQSNVCRMLSAPRDGRSLSGLGRLLEEQHNAPHGGVVVLPHHGVEVASASPEVFLQRDGDLLSSSPIKGTGRSAEDLLDKDTAENVMIVDLVRNDLGRVARTGSVSVPSLLRREEHPGLVHLVSTVSAQLQDGVGWPEILEATFPPGSVTGAPKSSACRLIDELEPTPRGAYCGAVGWVDATGRRADLAVGIRTFWADAERIYFGTGAGITWGSDAEREWDETELKAERLLTVAAQA
jgi:para-aminobenzoate synthetase component 1